MSSGNPETRNKILRAAWKLLEAASERQEMHRDVRRDVRMSDIAKAAGVSRQALYLHFPTRAELLVATTLYVDEVNDVDARLAESRSAKTGTERLDAFIEAWGNYIPKIYGVGKALMVMSETDAAAKLAWDGRMRAVRHGCRAAVDALARDKRLFAEHSPAHATDILWTLLSVGAWERLTIECGWSQRLYIRKTKALARRMLVGNAAGA